MPRIAKALGMLLLGSAAACASAGMPPVAVRGSEADVSTLAGEWAGEYAGGPSGRSGTIHFRLSAAGDTASGSVLMVPRGSTAPLHPALPEAGAVPAERAVPQDLTIRFVRVAGGRVSGVLDPYTDPECGCPLSTTFQGELRGDRIEGTFTAAGSRAIGPVTGTWSARRRP